MNSSVTTQKIIISQPRFLHFTLNQYRPRTVKKSRQSFYREADQVANAVARDAAQARIDELQRQLGEQRAEVQALQERLEHAISTVSESLTGRKSI